MNSLRKVSQFLLPKLRSVMRFLAAQGITLAGNVLFGLLCVRLLPASEYAKFVVLFAVQGTLVILMDVNFSGSLVPLIGERVNDKQLIADYVASLRKLSHRIFIVVGLGLVFCYPMLVKNRGWSWKIVASMIVTLLVSSWFIRVAAAYGAVLILLRDRSAWYKGQMISSLGTLALLGVCWWLGFLVGFTAIIINVLGLMFVGIFYFYRSQRLLGVAGVASREKTKAIIRLAAPNVPQSIFYAIQGQIPIFVITFLGRTSGVAGMGALGRLGQMFALLLQMNPILVEPYFAKLPKERLKSSYIAALSIAAVLCTSIAVVASRFPEVFLWVLGPTYSNLKFEVMLAIVASAISCFSAVLWFIHSARRFIYWWSNIGGIVLIFAVQLFFILKTDLGSLRMVLWLNVATNLASLLVNVLCGLYGFVKGPRRYEDTPVHTVASGEEAQAQLQIETEEMQSPGSVFPVTQPGEL